jgi:hypothetical protein
VNAFLQEQFGNLLPHASPSIRVLLEDSLGGFLVRSVLRQTWPDFLDFLVSVATLPNPTSSAIAIDLIALCIDRKLIDAGSFLPFALEFLASCYAAESFGPVQIAGLSLVGSLQSFDDISQVAPAIVHAMPLCPPDEAYHLSIALVKLSFGFFAEEFQGFFQTVLEFVDSRECPILARVRYLNLIEDIAQSDHESLRPFLEAIVPILVRMFTEFEESYGLRYSRIALAEIARQFDEEIHGLCFPTFFRILR